MWWVMVTALQAAAGPADQAAPRRQLSSRAIADERCDPAANEVVVCARSDRQAFRLKPLPNRFVATAALPHAETTIAGKVKLAAESEAGQALGGAPPRVMVRLKMPF